MTQEYQEATNEFLRVSAAAGCQPTPPRQPRRLLLSWSMSSSSTGDANPTISTEPKSRAPHGSLVRRLLGQGPRAVGPGEGIDAVRFHFLSIEAACCTRNNCSCDLATMGGGGDGDGGALGLIMGGDIGWCKYCTTLTMRHRFFGDSDGYLGCQFLFVVTALQDKGNQPTFEPVCVCVCVQRPGSDPITHGWPGWLAALKPRLTPPLRTEINDWAAVGMHIVPPRIR